MVKISNLHDNTENGTIKQYGVFLIFEWKGRVLLDTPDGADLLPVRGGDRHV